MTAIGSALGYYYRIVIIAHSRYPKTSQGIMAPAPSVMVTMISIRHLQSTRDPDERALAYMYDIDMTAIRT